MSFASPEKGNKRKHGLRLTPQHLQSATSSNTSPNNNTFREQIGHIVNGNSTENFKEQQQQNEETSLAATYLAMNKQEVPKPQNVRVEQHITTTPNHFMEIKVQDLSTLSRLGEGAAGTVRKVLHKPTELIMAKKVKRQKKREAFDAKKQNVYIVYFNRT